MGSPEFVIDGPVMKQINAGLSVVSHTEDPAMKLLYLAAIKVVLARHRADVDAADRAVVAVEKELARLAGTGQLTLEAPR